MTSRGWHLEERQGSGHAIVAMVTVGVMGAGCVATCLSPVPSCPTRPNTTATVLATTLASSTTAPWVSSSRSGGPATTCLACCRGLVGTRGSLRSSRSRPRLGAPVSPQTMQSKRRHTMRGRVPWKQLRTTALRCIRSWGPSLPNSHPVRPGIDASHTAVSARITGARRRVARASGLAGWCSSLRSATASSVGVPVVAGYQRRAR